MSFIIIVLLSGRDGEKETSEVCFLFITNATGSLVFFAAADAVVALAVGLWSAAAAFALMGLHWPSASPSYCIAEDDMNKCGERDAAALFTCRHCPVHGGWRKWRWPAQSITIERRLLHTIASVTYWHTHTHLMLLWAIEVSEIWWARMSPSAAAAVNWRQFYLAVVIYCSAQWHRWLLLKF